MAKTAPKKTTEELYAWDAEKTRQEEDLLPETFTLRQSF